MQFIYKSKETPLPTQRVDKFKKQSKAGILRPESYPPTVGSTRQHSLRAYLQLQDWLVLKSMSREATLYGWYVTSAYKFEPVLTLEPVAPENLLKFVSCNCFGNCSTKRCVCRKNNVKCISACGNCRGNQCNNMENEDTFET